MPREGERVAAGKTLIGCSGWDYDDWKGLFYPSSVTSKLAFYTKVFPTAEINATFYRMPDEGIVRGWARNTPEGFKFAAKVPQTVTHDARLDDAEADLELFCRRMEILKQAGKLGPLLLQLPPSLTFERERVKNFLSSLPKGFDFALEPREASWLGSEAVHALGEAGVALVTVDEPLLPPDLHLTADFAYIRWHGRGSRPWYNYEYSKEELQPWIPRIREALDEVPRVYGFFNNHYHGFGPKNALDLTGMLGVLTSEQQEVRQRLEKGRKAKAPEGTTLDAYIPKEGKVAREVETLLEKVTDAGRIERAKEISARDLAISKVEPALLRGDVHGTRLFIDLTEQVVRHNCPDYLRGAGEKRVCKHMVRLLLEIPPEIAREFVDDLARSKDAWKFEPYWRRGE